MSASALLGSIALRAWFADEPMEETPWIRGLLVLPAWRGRGVDRQLVLAAEDAARALEFRVAHCATSAIERLLRRRGWDVFRRVAHDGESLAWMQKKL